MPYVITSRCQGQLIAACVEVCPVDAIHGPTARGDDADPSSQLFIDPAVCICCSHCADTCPVGAPFAEDDVPAEHHADIQRNADYFAAGADRA